MIRTNNTLILEESDLNLDGRKAIQNGEFDVKNIINYLKDFEKIRSSDLVLFIDSDLNTTIIKNRYGNSQI